MKKVVIIGFLWPYVGGSKRVIGLARNLGEHGWEPIVATPVPERPVPESFRILNTGYAGLFGRAARLLSLSDRLDVGDQLKARVAGRSPRAKRVLRSAFHVVREVLAYPDEHRRWHRLALRSCLELAERESIDAVISVWPPTSHVVARDLKAARGLPWVADFADLWSDNSAYPYGRIRHGFDERLEIRTLRTADVLTTSSWPLAERLSALHGGRRVHDVLIGFDPGQVNDPPAPLARRFTISYTGIFYPGKRDPRCFLEVLGRLVASGKLA